MSKKTKKLVTVAMLIAIAVVLGCLSRIVNPFINLPFLRFSLAPVAIMFAGAAFGWKIGGAVGAITDVVTFLFFPTGGYFPGYTATMALYGILAALLFKDKPVTLLRTFVGTVSIQAALSMFLNTMWMILLLGPFDPVKLGARLVTSAVSCAVYILLLSVLMKNSKRIMSASVA